MNTLAYRQNPGSAIAGSHIIALVNAGSVLNSILLTQSLKPLHLQQLAEG